MMIERLGAILRAIGAPATALDIAEILWLAGHLPQPDEPMSAAIEQTEQQDQSGPAPPTQSLDNASSTPSTVQRPLYATASPEQYGTEAIDVAVPTAPLLRQSLKLQRALRPLKRRVASTRSYEFDEASTAASAAQRPPGMPWLPSFRPTDERWLRLALVVDTGPSMQMWQRLAPELRDILARVGAFTDLRIWNLINAPGKLAVQSGSGPLRSTRTLLDSGDRQVIAMLSDCSGDHWWNGRTGQVLRQWAIRGPTVVFQPLPERMWHRTAAPTVSGMASCRRSGAPNTDLHLVPFEGRVASEPGTVPVPVVELTPRWFVDWAQLVSTPGVQVPTAMTFQGGISRAPRASVRHARSRPIRDKVLRFQSVASPNAIALAAHAAVSEPTLPVLRLIQHRMLPNSRPTDLAEVLLSGLLRPVAGSYEHYEFIPEARKALLETLPRSASMSTVEVLKAVSDEIHARLGTGSEEFRAVVRVANEAGRRGLGSPDNPFALVSEDALAYLLPSARSSVDIQKASEPFVFNRSGVELPLPDPETSTAILIGIDHGAGLGRDPLPQISNDLVDLNSVLTDPEISGLSPERVNTFLNPNLNDVSSILNAIRSAAGTLFLYYSGLCFDNIGQTYLGLADTEVSEVSSTSLPMNDLLDAIEGSAAENILILINGCDIGSQPLDGRPSPFRQTSRAIRAATCMVASSDVWSQGVRNTPMGQLIVNALGNGFPGGRSLICADDFIPLLNLNTPESLLHWGVHGSGGNFALARNRMTVAGSFHLRLDLDSANLPTVVMAGDAPTNKMVTDSSFRSMSVVVEARHTISAWARLARIDPAQYEPHHAASLHNLSNRLTEAGWDVEALQMIREAVEIFDRLAGTDSERYRPMLAAALNNFGVALAGSGDLSEAVAAARRAVEIYTQLAEAIPGQYQPELGTALHNLSNRLAQVGSDSEAVDTFRRAIDSYAQAAEADPDRYRPVFAASIHNLAIWLGDSGCNDEALDAAGNAVEVCRAMAVQNPMKFLPDLAVALNYLAGRLGEAGRQDEELSMMEEAVNVYRELAEQYPERYLPDLNGALRSIARGLNELGRSDEAAVIVREADVLSNQYSTTRQPHRHAPP